MQLDVLELRDTADSNQATLPNDAHPSAGLLDLAHNVRGKENGATLVARLRHHRFEDLLVERIEAAGRLVEDQHARAVHEGLDQHHLALVSGRVLAELAAQVEVETLDELLEIGAVDPPAQVGEVLEDLTTGEARIQGWLAGDVADELLDLQRLLPAIEPGNRGLARVRTQ